MPPIRLRPRFRLSVPLAPEEVTDRLRRCLDAPDAAVDGKVLTDFAVLRVPPDRQHYWSPELTLQLDDEDGGGTLVRALFGPRPAVWTGFACCYTFAIFLSVMALLFGLSQMSLDMTPHGLWLLPIPVLLLVAAFATALVGQRLGAAQMHDLRRVLHEALDLEPDAGGEAARTPS